MCMVFTKWTVEADKASAELLHQKFEFSNQVRKAALDILCPDNLERPVSNTCISFHAGHEEGGCDCVRADAET
jgi:hypothetical protein